MVVVRTFVERNKKCDLSEKLMFWCEENWKVGFFYSFLNGEICTTANVNHHLTANVSNEHDFIPIKKNKNARNQHECLYDRFISMSRNICNTIKTLSLGIIGIHLKSGVSILETAILSHFYSILCYS